MEASQPTTTTTQRHVCQAARPAPPYWIVCEASLTDGRLRQGVKSGRLSATKQVSMVVTMLHLTGDLAWKYRYEVTCTVLWCLLYLLSTTVLHPKIHRLHVFMLH